MQQSKRSGTTLALIYLSTAVVVFALLAGIQYERAKRFERQINNNYQHAFDELVTAVTEVDTALQKSVYATSPYMVGNLCTEVFGKAMTAQMSLSALPFSSGELEQTAGFISRVGDYAFTLSRAAAAGAALSEEQLENLRQLSDAASVLTLNLKGMQAEVQDGHLTLTELTRAETTLDNSEAAAANYAGNSIRLIEQEFPEIPHLIYDGPFSEHLSNMAPKALEGLETVSPEHARQIAAGFLGLGKGKVVPEGESGGDIPCRLFSASGPDGASYSIFVTNQGGKVLSMLCARQVGDPVLEQAAAVEKAKQFLQDAGFWDMVETYHMAQGGILTANFASRQGDVLCYSDLVKVSVALDTGEICGFEARGYLTAHYTRELPELAVTQETAAAQVPDQLQVLSTQLALVPSDGKYETLCYEFKCEAEDGSHCLIYVNGQTGAQEKILILLEDASGTLTI